MSARPFTPVYRDRWRAWRGISARSVRRARGLHGYVSDGIHEAQRLEAAGKTPSPAFVRHINRLIRRLDFVHAFRTASVDKNDRAWKGHHAERRKARRAA